MPSMMMLERVQLSLNLSDTGLSCIRTGEMIRSRLHSCSENIVKKHQGKKKVSFASVGRKISAAFIFGNFWTMKTLSPASISKSTHSNTKWKLKTQTFLQAGSSETQHQEKRLQGFRRPEGCGPFGWREGGEGGCICVCDGPDKIYGF